MLSPMGRNDSQLKVCLDREMSGVYETAFVQGSLVPGEGLCVSINTPKLVKISWSLAKICPKIKFETTFPGDVILLPVPILTCVFLFLNDLHMNFQQNDTDWWLFPMPHWQGLAPNLSQWAKCQTANTQNSGTVLPTADSEPRRLDLYSSFLVTICTSRLVSEIFAGDRLTNR